MRFFVCLLDVGGRGIPEKVQRRYEALPRARGLEFAWQELGPPGREHFRDALVLVAWDDPWGDPLVARARDHVAVGMVRLDNREDIERLTQCVGEGVPDLELVTRAVLGHGPACISRLLGDFAFAVWDAHARTVTAATDAFAIKKLYYAEHDGFMAFASRAEALAFDDRYDAQFLAEVVTGCVVSPGLSPYAGVRQVPPANAAISNGRGIILRRHWSATDFSIDWTWTNRERDAAQTCRDLLAESVRLRLDPAGATWSQLSGGLDSSSIVCLAQSLAECGMVNHGLAGTVTYVDWQGTESDERKYSDAVVARWSIPNHTIVDPPIWQDADGGPPRTDWPCESLALYPRERRLLQVVRGAGGRVLLTGFAGDELFTGTMYFFADWIARGRVVAALGEMARRAAIGQASFWQLAYRNAVLPLVPQVIRRSLLQGQGTVLPWVTRTAVRRYTLRDRVAAAATYAGPLGRKYHHAVVTNVVAISGLLNAGFLGDVLDVRYPFLYRPLVEFALRLPPDLCVRPQARKWVLREAMRGILPEMVRTRIGKGGVCSVLGWSLSAQRSLLEPLLEEPILAELGIIDTTKLRAAFDVASRRPYREDHLETLVQSTLLLEAWLQLRSDRWPPTTRLWNAVPAA
jgi:asparagine synthase (glutamine-hydrolysing)